MSHCHYMFCPIVDNLDLHHLEDKTSSSSNTFDKINDMNFEKHPSICSIKTKYSGISNFSYRPVSVKEVKKIIRDLKTNKTVSGEIPTEVLKECEFTFDVLPKCINKFIDAGYFPDSLKLADVALVF